MRADKVATELASCHLDNFRARNATLFGSKRRSEARFSESTRWITKKNNAESSISDLLYDEEYETCVSDSESQACSFKTSRKQNAVLVQVLGQKRRLL